MRAEVRRRKQREFLLLVADHVKYAGAADEFPNHPIARIRKLVQQLGVRYVQHPSR